MKMRYSLRQLQNELWNRKRRNRGSSIVIVIITMAMIGILAMTILWMSYINYKIKVNDIRNKNSFYSAETVLEQIIAGLQKEASDSVAFAYQEVLSNWETLGSESNRYSAFATAYFDYLTKQLGSEDSGYYDRSKLSAYVDSDIWSNVIKSIWNNGTDEEGLKKPSAMEMVNGNSLILRNIFVAYTDGDRLSEISTDLCLDVPEIVFTQSGSVDKLYDYLLIGNQGVSLLKESGQVTCDGSIYAGTNAKGLGGLEINPASTLIINNARYVISKGDIDVVGPRAALIVRDAGETGSSVYAKSLDLQSGTISLDSKTYVANDLALSGNGSKATLTKEYYGYGTSVNSGIADSNGQAESQKTDQENSSAIIINGQNSTVDMSGVNTLMLAGRAYIGQNETKEKLDQKANAAAEGTASKNEQAVLMGESITVKGGQIAYLVPNECIGVYNGETVIGQNPVTQEQAAQLQSDSTNQTAGFQEVDFTRSISKLGGKSLSYFGVADMQHIRKVNTQYVSGGSNKSLTYYYLVMDASKAAEYYQIYYANNKESVDKYFKKYATGGILLGDDTSERNSYTILGNSLISNALSETGVNLIASTNTTTNTMSSESVAQKAQEIAGIYKGLTTNLSEDAASGSDTQTVFQSVIKKSISIKGSDGTSTTKSMEQYLRENGTNGTMTFTTTDGLKGIITANDYVLSETSGGASNVRLIVSLKDITIDSNFTGLAIAQGEITIKGAGAPSLNRNKMDLYKVLNATTGAEGDTTTPLAFFVNGDTSLADGVQEAETDDAGNLYIDYTKIVRYVNWVKK